MPSSLLALLILASFAGVSPSSSNTTAPRVLLVDAVFPNKLAAWRLNEVLAFMERFDTDILVVSRPSRFTFDWEALRLSHGLDRYNLLIFSPHLNYLNVHNGVGMDYKPRFDGRKFNRAVRAEYMLRLRKYGDGPVRFQDYAAVHHIFLHCWDYFNTMSHGLVPAWKQSIHLYPGGGMRAGDAWRMSKFKSMPEDVLLFPTQGFLSDYCRKHWPKCPTIPVYGAPYLRQGQEPVPKRKHGPTDGLVVCFSSIGNMREKGARLYVQLAEKYHRIYPNDNVTFYGVGGVPASPAVMTMKALPQSVLDEFYRNKVDVYFNLERTRLGNGWPLGGEAVVHGIVLFSTERFQQNLRNGFYFDEGLTIVDERFLASTLEALHEYAVNPEKLYRHSRAIQQRAFQVWGYDRQMKVILDAIMSRNQGSNVSSGKFEP
eukprot:RCo037759